MKRGQFRLPIIISRPSNQLFFASKINPHYLVKFGLQKYIANESVNSLFYNKSEGRIWRRVREAIGKQNAKRIKNAIALLRPSFASHWHKASKHLLSWKRYFQLHRALFQQIISDIKKLSGIKHFALSKIPVYLISDPRSNDKEINAWFSWMPEESFIVVEIPLGLKTSTSLSPLGILAHEFFHLILRRKTGFMLQINKVAEKNAKLFAELSAGRVPNRIFLEELLISSFIPEGYLSEKHLGIKFAPYTSKPKNLLTWRKLLASQLHKITRRYINGTRQIDREYLKHALRAIKQNVK